MTERARDHLGRRTRADFRDDLFWRVTGYVLEGIDPDAALELAVEDIKQEILLYWAQQTADLLRETGGLN